MAGQGHDEGHQGHGASIVSKTDNTDVSEARGHFRLEFSGNHFGWPERDVHWLDQSREAAKAFQGSEGKETRVIRRSPDFGPDVCACPNVCEWTRWTTKESFMGNSRRRGGDLDPGGKGVEGEDCRLLSRKEI